MRKIALALSVFFVVATSSPALADDDLVNRSQAVLQLATSLTESNASISAFQSGDLTLEHKLTQSQSITVASTFRGSEGKRHFLELSPNYNSYAAQTTTNLSSSISSDKNRLFVASTAQGSMRIVSLTYSKESTSSIEYKTSLPKDAYLLNVPNVGNQILTPDGTYYGTLSMPWAFDATKKRLSTSFSLVDGALIQRIVVTNETTYPVISDPNWTYSLDYWVNDKHSAVSTKTPNTVTAMLKSCFSCFFPIQGAPMIYPYVGQTMQLKIARPLPPFDTLPAPVKVSAVYQYGWKFTALPGHVDGAGSTIQFNWYSDAFGFLHLSVAASVVNPDPCGLWIACQPAYIAMARITWQGLFNNVTS
jgi:hypothetical protein